MRFVPKIINWMMPEGHRPNRTRMSYVETLGWGVLFTVILQIIYFVLFYLSNYTIGYMLNIICLLFSAISIFLLKKAKRARLAANIVAGIIFCNTVINSYFTGGLHSSILLWILIIPIVSIFILDRKDGLYWVVASLIETVILLIYSPLGSPNSIRMINNEDFDIWINLFLLIGVVWSSAVVIDNAKNKAISDAEEARIKLEAELSERESIELVLRESEEKLQRLANIDGLTGLKNRRHFFELAESEFERVLRYRLPLSIAIFDIDNFKSINDQFGHAVGDRILSEISKLCLEDSRNNDILARYGGEEFIILFPQTEGDEAFASSERIRMTIEKSPFPVNDKETQVTLSFGVASLSHEGNPNLDMLIDWADKALYQSKRKGKNMTTVWNEELS